MDVFVKSLIAKYKSSPKPTANGQEVARLVYELADIMDMPRPTEAMRALSTAEISHSWVTTLKSGISALERYVEQGNNQRAMQECRAIGGLLYRIANQESMEFEALYRFVDLFEIHRDRFFR